jgi:hypothetical protein
LNGCSRLYRLSLARVMQFVSKIHGKKAENLKTRVSGN